MNLLGFSAIDELKPDGSIFSSRLRHQSGFRLKKKMDFEIISEEESSQDSDNANAEAQHQVPLMNDDAEISRSQCNYLLSCVNYSLLACGLVQNQFVPFWFKLFYKILQWFISLSFNYLLIVFCLNFN